MKFGTNAMKFGTIYFIHQMVQVVNQKPDKRDPGVLGFQLKTCWDPDVDDVDHVGNSLFQIWNSSEENLLRENGKSWNCLSSHPQTLQYRNFSDITDKNSQ